MSSSGVKRSYGENGGEERKDKPKDWRDAFLDDDQPRRRERSRSRERRDRSRDDPYNYGSRDRSRHDDRYGNDRRRSGGPSNGGGLNYGEPHANDRQQRGPDRSRERERDGRDYHHNPHHHREQRERGDHRQQRSYGDRDRRRDDEPERDPRRLRTAPDQEDGEIASPARSIAPLPYHSPRGSAGGSPRRPPPGRQDAAPPLRGGFQAINVPSGPRSNQPQDRPDSDRRSSGSRQQEVEKAEEPIVVIEEQADPEKALEERRRKREEIMAKFKASGGKPVVPASPSGSAEPLGPGGDSVVSAGLKTGARTGYTSASGAASLLRVLGTKSTNLLPGNSDTPTQLREPSLANTPLGKEIDLSRPADGAVVTSASGAARNGPDDGVEAISAADYDPTAEGLADQQKRQKDREDMAIDKASALADGLREPVKVEITPVAPEKAKPAEDEWEEVEMEQDVSEEEDDMFAAFGGDEKPKKKRKVIVRRRKTGGAGGAVEVRPVETKPSAKEQSVLDIVDNVDDTEGYYRITPGEILDDGRYQVTITLGKGMFSAVVKAKVLKAVDQERRQDVVGKEVAIKVIRSQESMYVAGRKEAQILKKLNEADPEDKKHIVRLERTFEHRNHLCIVTESLSMNLRDVIKRFGKDVGLNTRAVRAYAHQLFLSLSLMRKCSIVHADIKPDNILVSENKATLKVCDFGSAAEVTEGEITPYLVSRFYRAPEIILGLPYDTAIDVWSIGCTLYELYTGKILFPGRSNNHMLLLMMEVKGKFNHRMIKKASFGEMHFDEGNNFISIERDKITGQDTLKTLVINKATRDLRSRLLPASSVQLKMKDEEIKQITNFIDLLEKCLQLDPVRRISPRDALLHPFLTS